MKFKNYFIFKKHMAKIFTNVKHCVLCSSKIKNDSDYPFCSSLCGNNRYLMNNERIVDDSTLKPKTNW